MYWVNKKPLFHLGWEKKKKKRKKKSQQISLAKSKAPKWF
jgi:hypothetical protein